MRCDIFLRYWWEVDWGGFGVGSVWPWRRHLQSGRPGQRLLGRKAWDLGQRVEGLLPSNTSFGDICLRVTLLVAHTYNESNIVKRLPISQYEIITVYICMPLGCICTEMFAVFCLKALWLVSRKAWSTSDLHVKCLEAFLRWHSDATVSVTRDDHQCRIRHFSSLALKAAVGISI